MEGAMEEQLRGNNEDVYTVRWRDFRMYGSYGYDGCTNAEIKGLQHDLHLLMPKLCCRRGNPSSFQSTCCKYKSTKDGERSTNTTFFCLEVCCQQLYPQNFSSSCFQHLKSNRKNPFPSKPHKYKLQPKQDIQKNNELKCMHKHLRFFPPSISQYIYSFHRPVLCLHDLHLQQSPKIYEKLFGCVLGECWLQRSQMLFSLITVSPS